MQCLRLLMSAQDARRTSSTSAVAVLFPTMVQQGPIRLHSSTTIHSQKLLQMVDDTGNSAPTHHPIYWLVKEPTWTTYQSPQWEDSLAKMLKQQFLAMLFAMYAGNNTWGSLDLWQFHSSSLFKEEVYTFQSPVGPNVSVLQVVSCHWELGSSHPRRHKHCAVQTTSVLADEMATSSRPVLDVVSNRI